jgi:hypothetical protein
MRRRVNFWTAAIAVCTLAGLLALVSFAMSSEGEQRWERPNGFDMSISLIPREEVFHGGPPKDGIPALTSPLHLKATDAHYLSPHNLVIGVVVNGEARAYPVRILTWHENVNDVLGGIPIAVTYCPLCNSALVFDRRIGGVVREFGISGLLWKSNVLLYDRHKDRDQESLWSQVEMRAVTGPAAREELRLRLLPSELTTRREWLKRHAQSTVLSDKTGYRRDYAYSPYEEYFRTDRLMFPVGRRGTRPERFRDKEPMLVVQAGQRWKAYAVKDVAAQAGKAGILEDVVGGKKLRLAYSKEAGSVRAEVVGEQAESPPVAYMFWFVLNAVLPEVETYEPPVTAGEGGKKKPG